MSESTSIIGKTARSKDGVKLGEIIRVEGKPNNLTIANRLHVVIESDRPLADSDIVQVLLDKMYNVDEEAVYFDISMDEFKERQVAYRFIRQKNSDTDKARTKLKEDYKKATLRTLSRFRS